MCRAGNLKRPLNGMMMKKGMVILTTHQKLYQTLHGQICNHQHNHQPTEGTTITKDGPILRTEYTAIYPRKFSRTMAKILGRLDSVPMLCPWVHLDSSVQGDEYALTGQIRVRKPSSIRYHSSQTSGQTCHQNFVLWVLLVFFAGACRIGEAANPGPPPTPPYDPKLLSDTNDVLWVGNCNPGQLFGKEDIVLEWGGGIWTFSETSATTPAIKYLRSKFKEKNVMPFLGNLFVHTKILPSCVVGQGELQLFPNYHAESTISLHQISFIHQLDSWTRLLICMGADLSMYAQFMEQQIIINMIWQLLKIYSTRPLKELSLSVVRQ